MAINSLSDSCEAREGPREPSESKEEPSNSSFQWSYVATEPSCFMLFRWRASTSTKFPAGWRGTRTNGVSLLQDPLGSSRCDFAFIALARVITKKSNCFRRAASLRARATFSSCWIYIMFSTSREHRGHTRSSLANWAFASDSRSKENFYANQESAMNSKSRVNFQRYTRVSNSGSLLL